MTLRKPRLTNILNPKQEALSPIIFLFPDGSMYGHIYLHLAIFYGKSR